jgi:hypothetical protein
MPAVSPRVRVAQILEDCAIELDGASNRLRALGMTPQSEQVGKQAMSLAVVARSITGRPSDALALYFGIGQESPKVVAESMLPEDIERAVQPAPPPLPPQPATDATSVASTNRSQRVPAEPVRHPSFLHVRRVSS